MSKQNKKYPRRKEPPERKTYCVEYLENKDEGGLLRRYIVAAFDPEHARELTRKACGAGIFIKNEPCEITQEVGRLLASTYERFTQG